MKPVPAADLPDVLQTEDIGKLLGIRPRTVQDHMKLRSWPFTPIPGFTHRWAKAHVLAVLEGRERPRTRITRVA